MGEIVNLNKVRKQRAKQGREARAAENRVVFGRKKDAREAEKAASDKADQTLDGKRLD